jgi:hypothetical protein
VLGGCDRGSVYCLLSSKPKWHMPATDGAPPPPPPTPVIATHPPACGPPPCRQPIGCPSTTGKHFGPPPGSLALSPGPSFARWGGGEAGPGGEDQATPRGPRHYFVIAGSRIPVPAVNCMPSPKFLQEHGERNTTAGGARLGPGAPGREAGGEGPGEDEGGAPGSSAGAAAGAGPTTGPGTTTSSGSGAQGGPGLQGARPSVGDGEGLGAWGGDAPSLLQAQLYNRVRAERALRMAKAKADRQRHEAELVSSAIPLAGDGGVRVGRVGHAVSGAWLWGVALVCVCVWEGAECREGEVLGCRIVGMPWPLRPTPRTRG